MARRPTPAASPKKRKWGLWVAVAVLLVAAAIWAVKLGRSGRSRSEEPSTIPLTSALPSDKPHMNAFLASLPNRLAQSVTDVKAEEKALAEAALADFSGQALPLSLLAAVYQSHGDIQQAEMLWKKALTIDPSQSRIYERLGQLAQEQDLLEQAVTHWEKGLRENPRAPNLRWHLANARVQQGRLDGTVELLEAECALTPNAARNYFLLGQVHLKQKAYEQAKTCYEKALELQPDYFNAHYGLGKVYMRLKQREKAGASMDAYKELKASHDASDEQRIVLDELPRVRARAAGLYRRVLDFYDLGKYPAIRERLLKRAIFLDPGNARTWEKLATDQYQLKRFQTALRYFQKARDLDPNNPIYYFNIGMLHGGMGQSDRAEASLKQAIDRFPRYGLAYAELARFYLQFRTKLAESRSLAEQAVALEPSAAHYFILARACQANGDRSQAADAAKKALTLEPDNERYRAFYVHLQSER